MRTPISISVLLLVLQPGRAFGADDGWAEDKALHFGVSAGLGAAGYALSSLIVEPRWQRAAAGAGLALAAGAGKELYDLGGAGDASWKDFTWDVAGAIAGVTSALVIDLALSPRHDRTETASQRLTFRF